MLPNPLTVLGVSRRTIVFELERNTPERILRLAQLNYRALAKQYHPDSTGGDAALMAEFADAISELRDPSVLDIYARDLVDRSDVQDLQDQRMFTNEATRRNESLDRLAKVFGLNQFTNLGVDEPTTFLSTLGDGFLVLNVSSANEDSRVQLAIHHKAANPNQEPRFCNGRWEVQLKKLRAGRVVWQPLLGESTGVGERVRVAGLVYKPDEGQVIREWSQFGVQSALLSEPSSKPRLAWQTAGNAWFLNQVEPSNGSDLPRRVVMWRRDGKFAVSEPIWLSAPLA